MKHYKVVREYNNQLQSCVAEGHALVIYEVDQWVRAPATFAAHDYHLLVFTSLKEAQSFASPNDWYKVYEVEVRGVVNLPENGCYDFWFVAERTIPQLQQVRLGSAWPYGTRMVREVKLVQLVSKKE